MFLCHCNICQCDNKKIIIKKGDPNYFDIIDSVILIIEIKPMTPFVIIPRYIESSLEEIHPLGSVKRPIVIHRPVCLSIMCDFQPNKNSFGGFEIV